MSHLHDERNTPELNALLEANHLSTDTHSQLSDAFRLGYWSAQAEIARLQEEVERLRNTLDHNTKANDAIVAALLESEATARNYALEEAARLAETSINDGGLAKSMAHFIEVEHWRVYKESCLKYASAIRALKRQ